MKNQTLTLNLQSKMEQNQNPTVTQGSELDKWFDEITPEVITDTSKEEVPLDSLFETPIEPVSKTEVKKEEPNQEVKVDNILKAQAEFLIEKGYWQDGAIEIQGEDGEMITVEISDLEMTPELFEQIEQSQKALKEEELKSKYISVEGLDDNTKKMIEIKKAKGDISTLLQVEAEYVNPLKDLDLENEQHCEYLVRQKYAAQGLEQDIIDFKIDKLKKEVALDEEAKKIYEEVNTNFTNLVDSKKQEHLQKLEEQKEEQKAWKKTLQDTYKNLDIKDENLVKTLVEKSSKLDEFGLSETDKLYLESKKNPTLHAKLNFLLNNEEKFNEFMGVKIKNDITKTSMKTIFKLSPKVASQKQEVKKPSTNELDAAFEK